MTVEKEIESVLYDVEAAFSKLNIEEWLKCFHPTRLIVLPNAVLSPATAAECEEQLGGYIDNLRSQGYNRSELTQLTVRPLTETTAMASAVWSRFSSESIIEKLGATYLFIKAGKTWEIAMVTAHPENA